MRLLGAVLAGGRSQRFGSDKALAIWRGRTLLAHVTEALTPHVDRVILCGRDLPDRPAPDLGPLGGLNAALWCAAEHGFDRVITTPCDTPLLSGGLLTALAAAHGPAAIVAELPVIGSWPMALAPALDAWLVGDNNRAVRAWAEAVGATPLQVAAGDVPANINHADDLAALGD